MMKVFEADQKRLKSILQTYEEKKSDLVEREKKERLEVISMAKDCFTLFKLEYNDQTTKFEKGQLATSYLDVSAYNGGGGAMDVTYNNNTSRIDSQTNVTRMNLNYNQQENETVSAFMFDDGRDIRIKHEQ